MPKVIHQLIKFSSGYELPEFKCEISGDFVSTITHYVWIQCSTDKECLADGHIPHWYRNKYDIN